MEDYSELFIGLDASKLKVSVAVAEGERNGEVRFLATSQLSRRRLHRWWPSWQSGAPSFASATRQARPDTIFIGRS